MANDFFNKSNAPATGSSLSSATQRAEFAAIEQGFDKLPTLTAHGDEVVMVNSGATALTTKTKAAVIGEATTAAASKATPVDADEVPIADSAASFALKKLTWANLKAAIKTYYDSVTATLTNKTLTSPDINGGTWNGVIDGNVTSTGNPSLNLGTGALTAGAGTFSGALSSTGNASFGTTGAVGVVKLARHTDGAYVSEVRLSGMGAAPALELYNSVASATNIYSAGAVVGAFSSTGLSVSGGVSATTVDGSFASKMYWGSGTLRIRLVDSTAGIAIESNNPGESAYYPLSFTGSSVRINTGAGINAAIFDASGNLGLGVTPSAWGGGFRALQIYGRSSIASDNANRLWLNSDCYNNGTNWLYGDSGVKVSQYRAWNGEHAWFTAPSGTADNPITFTQAMTLDANGNFLVGTTSGATHTIKKAGVEGNVVLEIYGTGSKSVHVFDTSGTGVNVANSAVWLQKNSVSNRSLNAAGTINASGADYAEYERNNGLTIPKGAIVGFKADGTLTLTFADAVRFGIKSTNPSYVGGDTWGNEDAVGDRPEQPIYQAPDYNGPTQPEPVAAFVAQAFAQSAPALREVAIPDAPIPPFTPTRGDDEDDISWARQVNAYVIADALYLRDVQAREAALAEQPRAQAEYAAAVQAHEAARLAHEASEAERLAQHQAALAKFDADLSAFRAAQAAHALAVQAAESAHTVALAAYHANLSAFEATLEAARILVDRVAYSGKVPVNVTGATAGDYIVAANDNGTIKGIVVADPDFAQYKKAVGRVNRILPDGRAEVAVMVH